MASASSGSEIQLKQQNEQSGAHCNFNMKVYIGSSEVAWNGAQRRKTLSFENYQCKSHVFFLSLFTDLVLSFVFAVCLESCRREGKSCYFDRNNDLRCCDRQCQGGCTGGGPGDCIACKNVFSLGYCKDYCSPTTFEVTTIYYKQVKSKIGKMSQRSKNRTWPFEFV